MSTAVPVFVQTMHERLDFHFSGPTRLGRLDSFRVDLSTWKLSFTDRTPCLWVHTPEQLSQPALELGDEIRDTLREYRLYTETVIVLVDGPADELRRQLASSPERRIIVLDDQQQQEIAAAAAPTRATLDVCIKQLDLLALAPYDTSNSVTGSRFFGRRAELNKILSHPDRNYLLLGVRRIGKTSLLLEVRRQLDAHDPPAAGQTRRAYIDCSVLTSSDELFREIAMALHPRALKELTRSSRQAQRSQTHIFAQLADLHGGAITFVLDEIDRLLDHLHGDYSLFDVLRRASLQGSARFLLAGYRKARYVTNPDKSPLYHFAERLDVGPLKEDDVRQMVQYPLEQLRVKFSDRDELLRRIVHETGGLPNLVQFYCRTLLEELAHSGDDTIGLQTLHAVYRCAEFRDTVIQNFLTNAAPLEQAIVFALVGSEADDATFTVEAIDHHIRDHGLRVKLPALDNACRNLELAGILNSEGMTFRFTVPLFGRMLTENYPVGYALEQTLTDLRINAGDE